MNSRKIWYGLTALVTAGVATVAVVSSTTASAAPTPTFCVPYVATDDTWPTATLRTTVKVCTPVNDDNTVTSTCEIVELVRTDGLVAVVSNTCQTSTTSATKTR